MCKYLIIHVIEEKEWPWEYCDTIEEGIESLRQYVEEYGAVNIQFIRNDEDKTFRLLYHSDTGEWDHKFRYEETQ